MLLLIAIMFVVILVYTKNPVAKLSKYIQIPSNSTYMYTDWKYQFEKYDALNVCFMDKEAAQKNRIKVVATTNTTNLQSKVRTFKMSRQQELSQDSVITIVRYWPSHFTQNGHMTIKTKKHSDNAYIVWNWSELHVHESSKKEIPASKIVCSQLNETRNNVVVCKHNNKVTIQYSQIHETQKKNDTLYITLCSTGKASVTYTIEFEEEMLLEPNDHSSFYEMGIMGLDTENPMYMTIPFTGLNNHSNLYIISDDFHQTDSNVYGTQLQMEYTSYENKLYNVIRATSTVGITVVSAALVTVVVLLTLFICLVFR